jgi:hypothetical protein
MRKLEGLVKEIVDEMGYLKKREERFADTNSAFSLAAVGLIEYYSHTGAVSTQQRVQNFAWFTLASLTGLGVWQIFHLRSFFRRKYLID